MTWDEENRLMGINDNGRIHQYTYDAGGERVIKSSGDSQNVAINGQTAATIVHTDDYTGYVSPYFVISKGKFTKHYFEGAGRIVSKLGNGAFAQPLGITAGAVNYTSLTAEQQKAMDLYVKSLGLPPGPPTQQGIYATPEFTGDPYPTDVLKPTEENQEPPEGWPRNPIFNKPGDVPGPPVQFGPPVQPGTVKPAEGFTGIGLPENDIFYFHPDHLGSTSYITTRNGSISQHVEYIAFGEVLFEEHASSFSSPYLFNGKELDRETNLSYYGARYLDMKTSLWLSVDPLTEKMANYGAYVYTFNNPIRFTDPTGMIAEPPTGVDAEDGATHTDSSGSWKYDKASTTWVGQKDKNGVKSKDLGNTIELDNVNVKGYKSNYVSSGDYGPSYGREKDLQYSLMLVGAIAGPILAVEGGIAAGGSYLYSEAAAALSQITWGSAGINMASNATAQYLANGRSFGDINMASTASSIVPGIGPAIFGETIGWTPNNIMKGQGFQTPESFNKWAVQAGSAVLSNRFAKASDNYLSGSGFGEAMVREYFKGIVAVGANSAPQGIK